MPEDLVARVKRLYGRNPEARRIVEVIETLGRRAVKRLGRPVKIMNFCGTHEWTITHYGIRSLMPEGVELVAGPGCPVCVTPGHYVEALANLSVEGITILTYGDAFRLPARRGSRFRSLADARAAGGSVNVVYSFLDAMRVAKENSGRDHIFFAVGFETTMPSTSHPIAASALPPNLKVLTAYRLTPPVMRYMLESVRDVTLDGIIAPGHVSAVIGSEAWSFLPKEYGVPTVVSGFEPVDVLLSILYILKMVCEGRAALVNEYSRVVTPSGNRVAWGEVLRVHDFVDAYWRGIGVVSASGAVLKESFRSYDACVEYGISVEADFSDVMPGCRCGDVVLGRAKPTECPHFMRSCTPLNPYGPCMVSHEGTCRIWGENLPAVLNVLRRVRLG